MASIRKEIVVDSRPEHVWAALRDVGAVHQRLMPGRVVNTRLEGDARVLTLENGREIRELIVDVDDEARRLAYAVVAGGRMPITHHHASFQVLACGSGRCRVVWITDVLPNSLAAEVRARVEVGAEAMKRTLEAQAVSAYPA